MQKIPRHITNLLVSSLLQLKSQFIFLCPSTTRTVQIFLETLVSRKVSFFFPHLDIKFSFWNNYTIATLFRFKDRLPVECLSNVIYKFTFGSCNATYVGSTRQNSKVMFHQHLGTSNRTGLRLTTPLHSLPRNHSLSLAHRIHLSDF